MSYNLYITKANWFDHNKIRINLDEWLHLVDGDTELVLETDLLAIKNGTRPMEDIVVLVRWPVDDEDPTFVYSGREGMIRVKSPETNTIRKMLQIAEKLGAFVQGEGDEIYRLTDQGIESTQDEFD